jgi:DNA-binding response OmpR family regulator
MKVLIVEDERLVGRGLESDVGAAGHVVVGPVSSAGAALLLAQSARPSVALIDLTSEQSCPELVRVFKSALGVPSIVLTGHTQNISEYAHLSLGVVAKPASQACICATLDIVAHLISGGERPESIPEELTLFN